VSTLPSLAQPNTDALVGVLDSMQPPTPKAEPPPKLPPKLATNFVMLDVDINAHVEGGQKNEPMALVEHDFKIQVRLLIVPMCRDFVIAQFQYIFSTFLTCA
jgi:hypothetical protein